MVLRKIYYCIFYKVQLVRLNLHLFKKIKKQSKHSAEDPNTQEASCLPSSLPSLGN